MSKCFWGELIGSLRREIRMSQRQLCVIAKVNRSTLRRIEDGDARFDLATIERLLAVLGYELEAVSSEAAAERRRLVANAALCPGQRSKVAASTLLRLSAADMRE